jgi:hypothetical protein
MGYVLRHPLGPTAVDASLQGNLAAGHLHFDVRGVDVSVLGQAVVDILPNPVVRPLVPTRSPAHVRAGPDAGTVAVSGAVALSTLTFPAEALVVFGLPRCAEVPLGLESSAVALVTIPAVPGPATALQDSAGLLPIVALSPPASGSPAASAPVLLAAAAFLPAVGPATAGLPAAYTLPLEVTLSTETAEAAPLAIVVSRTAPFAVVFGRSAALEVVFSGMAPLPIAV